MQKVLTAAEMREVDRLTTERYGIPSILLMENAAHAAARVITEKLGGSVKDKRILILCGPGNNGGDGAALARILWTLGADCFVYLIGNVNETSGDALINFEAILAVSESDETNGPNENCLYIMEVNAPLIDNYMYQWTERPCDCVVDAFFGTGLTRPIDGVFRKAVDKLLDRRGFPGEPLFVSLDLPSGLDADRAEPIGPHVKADVTVTFTSPKPANVLIPAATIGGELVVAAIGTPQGLTENQPGQLFLSEKRDARRWLNETRFAEDSYKNKRGHALIIAGSRNYTGAAVLAGDAAIRSGCGLVTIATPESSRESIVARVSPEVMVRGIDETSEGSAAVSAVEQIHEFLDNVDVIAIGSGLSSKEDETKTFVEKIVSERKTPVIIDADGLTALSPWKLQPPLQKPAGSKGTDEYPLILTPHEGEFRKLLGVKKEEAEEILKDRVEAVKKFATENQVFLVLKGERNLIASPDGRVVVNPTGNSGLGKAGNGDTLTGIIAGFVAQAVQMEIDILETIVAAVYIAGLAGDVAEKKYGKRVMTASDVRECLVDVFCELNAGPSGLVHE